MSASRIPESACPSCGEELPAQARFCPSCGAPAGELPPLETVSGPVVRERVERRWLGLPTRFVLLCLGFAALGAAVGLFATGSWAWGILSLVVALVLLATLAEGLRRGGHAWAQQSSRLAAGGRAQAATAAEVWRARLEASLARRRAGSRLDRIELDRAPVLQALGDAVWRGDRKAAQEARRRLEELEDERRRLEAERDERIAGVEERIRRARLPVQKTMMVTPNEPAAPYPPPGEADPPQPATVPEPYPPPDEGTPPVPAPDPGQADDA